MQNERFKRPLLISACLLGEPCRYDGRVKNALPDGSNGEGSFLSRLRERYRLIPVCPEVFGGLPTPRLPSECVGERVVRCDGEDVTAFYERGAQTALCIARAYGCQLALLKARSPSCGLGRIYDGSFTGTLCERDGVTVRRLLENGLRIFTEENAQELLSL